MFRRLVHLYQRIPKSAKVAAEVTASVASTTAETVSDVAGKQERNLASVAQIGLLTARLTAKGLLRSSANASSTSGAVGSGLAAEAVAAGATGAGTAAAGATGAGTAAAGATGAGTAAAGASGGIPAGVIALIVAVVMVVVYLMWTSVAGAAAATQAKEASLNSADIPPVAAAAYEAAAQEAECVLPPAYLAAFGKVETNHGRHGGSSIQPDGLVEPPIFGAALDGNGVLALPVPPGGSPWHTNPVWDHASGPMQFTTETWAAFGPAGGTPHNINDAAHAAASLLCTVATDFTSAAARRDGAARYYGADDATYRTNIETYYNEYLEATEVGPGATTIINIPGDGFAHPIPGGAVTSPFGYRVHPIAGTKRLHTGWDITGGFGTPIYAAEAGVISSAGWGGGYGNLTIIDHGEGLSTYYAHQSSFAVTSGPVQRGQLIGYVGSTGYSTGPHLHFEVRTNGTPVDPTPYMG